MHITEMTNLAMLCNKTVTLYLQQLVLWFPFSKVFLTLNLYFLPYLCLCLWSLCLCTCWRLKRGWWCGALFKVAGSRRSPFPLTKLDMCAQDSARFCLFVCCLLSLTAYLLFKPLLFLTHKRSSTEWCLYNIMQPFFKCCLFASWFF